MLMTKGLDLKILYTLLIAVSGIVLTIGAASALMEYVENLEVDNGAGDSSIKVTSSTGDSKLILEDQGKRTWSVKALDGKNKLQIIDETKNKARLTIKPGGQVGIGTSNPSEKLDVNGNVRIRMDANIGGDLNVDGILTGAYIATLEATILDLQTRLAALEASMTVKEPMIVSNEGMITTNGAMISNNAGNITINQAEISENAGAIEQNAEDIAEGGGGPNPCDPDGDAVITPDEMFAYTTANGLPYSLGSVTSRISIAEGNINSPMTNGQLDTAGEVNEFNGLYLIPNEVPACLYP